MRGTRKTKRTFQEVVSSVTRKGASFATVELGLEEREKEILEKRGQFGKT